MSIKIKNKVRTVFLLLFVIGFWVTFYGIVIANSYDIGETGFVVAVASLVFSIGTDDEWRAIIKW